MSPEVPNTYDALFWAYSAVWVILCIYVWSLGARVRKLEERRHLADGE